MANRTAHMTDTKINPLATCLSVRRSLSTGLLIASFAALLSGCDRSVGATTPGQKLDAALATGEQKIDNLRAESRTAGERLSDTASEIGSKVTATASDAGVTARVKFKLANDAALNALKIDVDTSAGRVTLTGSTPDAAARERATTLALSADGVLAVDNKLQLAPLPR